MAQAKRRTKQTNDNRFTVPIPQSLVDGLERHRLKGEKTSTLCNRLLACLAEAVERKTMPEEPPKFDAKAPNAMSIAFRARPEVMSFIQAHSAKWQLTSKKEIAVLLLNWACQLPIVQPIEDAEGVYNYLLDNWDISTLIPAYEAVQELKQFCSPQNLIRWLLDLEGQGLIRLRTSTPEMSRTEMPRSVSFTFLKDNTHKIRCVHLIEIYHGLPTITAVAVRSLLQLNLVQQLDLSEVEVESDQELLDVCVEEVPPNARIQYIGYARDFIESLGKPLQKLESQDFYDYLDSKEEVLDKTTVGYIETIIHSLISFGYRIGYLSLDPAGLRRRGKNQSDRQTMLELRDSLVDGQIVAVTMNAVKVGYLMHDRRASAFPVERSITLDANVLNQPDFYRTFLVACHQVRDKKLDCAWIRLRDAERTRLALMNTKIVGIDALSGDRPH